MTQVVRHRLIGFAGILGVAASFGLFTFRREDSGKLWLDGQFNNNGYRGRHVLAAVE